MVSEDYVDIDIRTLKDSRFSIIISLRKFLVGLFEQCFIDISLFDCYSSSLVLV